MWNVKLEECGNREEKRKQNEILLQFYFYFILFSFFFFFFLNKNSHDVKSYKSSSDEEILRNDHYKIKMQLTIDEFI